MIFDFCGLGCGIETFEFVRLVFLLESSPHPRFTASSLEKERPSAERRVGRAFAIPALIIGLRQDSFIPQKRNAGKDTAESTSVETLASRQRSASASRVAWACAAY